MVAQSQIHAAIAMGQHHEPRDSHLQGWGELQRWGSLTSNASSSDWNDIGLPPLPRQRSGGSPSSEHLTRQGSDDAACQAQQYQTSVRYAHSMPLPDGYLMQQQSLQGVSSGQLEALVFEAARRSGSPRYASADADAMLDCDNQAWEGLSPAVYAAAAAAALARPRRPQQTLHSSISVSSTSSNGCNSQPLMFPQQQHTRERAFSHTGSFSNGNSPVAMDQCYSSSSARPLPVVDLQRQGSPTQADLQRTQGQARLTPQEVIMLAKLKNIVSEREQLNSVELELRHQLVEEAHKAHSGSPRAAAAAAAAAAKPAALHQQQQQQRPQHRSSSFNTSRGIPQARHAHHVSAGGAPAASGSSGSPIRRHNSTAAALLAAAADPLLVAEYMRAHKQQQQQHQACFAAAAASAAAGGGVCGAAKAQGGLPPAAMAKLRQLMALQQQQIHAQQELLAMLSAS